ncbi:hypothetical protein ANDROMEDA_56 [Bacillus phage Andromeda]|uniref:Uncharacterized protein n=2 Tax=Andromedavirus andromeda TaxID=1273739 RepID=M1IF64_9CAUD|nr:hypothetical protein I905_gp56 [Bacillus phage Andromeda]AGE60895.1 hypothetical protein GEMINI_56 [Bacillus phage Gemini]AGE61126.1 hypothetical protein ANDROMEDA_56 [Bacillus phage Andromeda]
MWKWLENLFYNKALITTELVEKDEALKQCYDAWMDDRSQLNGARLELKTARKKIDELDKLIRVKKVETWTQENQLKAFIHLKEQGDLQRKEMQERIDELENEVYDLTVELNKQKELIKFKSQQINAKQMRLDRLEDSQ